MPETLLRLHFLSLLLLCSCAFLSSSSTIDVDDVVVGLVACRSRQIEAFTQFTNEFDTRWCNHSDYSNGVWCNHSDNSTGAVTKIQLTACLSGTLKPNSSLFGFHQLRHLDLSNNNFISSTLPSKFGNLNRLENKLIGSFPLISNLTKLSVLSLSQNLFAGAIPSSIFTMPSLFYLNVNDNHLTGPHEVPDSSTSSSLESEEERHSASRSAPRGGRGSSASSSRLSGSSHEQNSVPAYVPAPAPAPAPYVPAPAAQEDPGVMSVQQLVQQPGRVHLPVLHPNPRPGHTTWFDKLSNGISRSINNMMYSMLHTGYSKWSVIPREDRELWFRQFAQEFT
ncbi:hypothetical protein F2Q70_00025218 [Brassica cretica]|uniref:Leucine-rich repeat-containing N-terminal plant-type domain-containing protein n=1 Tax=Brassica cretica TaxID=69181 RepID=A0A8S9LA13_BRACR|nr:hypothetical protein F2Q70_00025218 [Brassica cretica]